MQQVIQRLESAGLAKPFVGQVERLARKHSMLEELVNVWDDEQEDECKEHILADIELLMYSLLYEFY